MRFLGKLKIPAGKNISTYCVVLILIAATSIAYWNVDKLEFLSIDDNYYVYGNSQIRSGITPATVKWAFSTTFASNWHPLTWISHMVDYQLYRLKPAGHHLTNFLFHVLNAVLLFFVLKMMTGSLIKSACVALLFGLHPLHVESVAWVSERKDVLSTFFMLIAMVSYSQFVLSAKRRFYFCAIIAFALGLMSKPMLVTLPFVLLLLDYWPFLRIKTARSEMKRIIGQKTLRSFYFLIIEKIPFFVLSALSCIVTYAAQHAGNAVVTTVRIPLFDRICNAAVSYVTYIGKMIWPVNSALYYPYSERQSLWLSIGAAVLLLCITVAFIRLAKSRPYGIAGWLWFLGTLVPVIGFVQVGGQEMADRYTYIPFIGLFIILAWGMHDISKLLPVVRPFIAVGTAIAFILLTLQTHKQVEFWKNDLTIAQRALSVTGNNFMAYNIKADYFLAHENYDEAKRNYLKSLAICPSSIFPRLQIGWICLRLKQYSEAIDFYSEILAYDSTNLKANANCGIGYLMQNDFAHSRQCLDRALQKDSLYRPALYAMGRMYEKLNNPQKAAYYFSKAGIKKYP